jgi:hypothetical protein
MRSHDYIGRSAVTCIKTPSADRRPPTTAMVLTRRYRLRGRCSRGCDCFGRKCSCCTHHIHLPAINGGSRRSQLPNHEWDLPASNAIEIELTGDADALKPWSVLARHGNCLLLLGYAAWPVPMCAASPAYTLLETCCGHFPTEIPSPPGPSPADLPRASFRNRTNQTPASRTSATRSQRACHTRNEWHAQQSCALTADIQSEHVVPQRVHQAPHSNASTRPCNRQLQTDERTVPLPPARQNRGEYSRFRKLTRYGEKLTL